MSDPGKAFPGLCNTTFLKTRIQGTELILFCFIIIALALSSM